MKTRYTLNKLAIAMAAALTVTVAMPVMEPAHAGFFMNDVAAAEDGDHGSGGHMGGGGQGQRGGQGAGEKGGGHSGSGGKGGHSTAEVLADDGGEEEESDKPAWAGRDGDHEQRPGGGNAGGSTMKGGDYGDLVVMLRTDDGTIVAEGNTTYAVVVAADGTFIRYEEVVGGELPSLAEGESYLPVEFGRLNVARSPASVLEHSLVEALSKLDGATEVTVDAAGRLVFDGVTIDSPLENLALYEALLTTDAVDGVITLTVSANMDGQDVTYSWSIPEDMDRLDLAAAALAAASDKTGDLTIDEIMGITSFVGAEDALADLVASYTYDPNLVYEGRTADVLLNLEPFEDKLVSELIADGFITFTPVDAYIQDNVEATGIDVFTQAADDAVQVLEFIHEYDIPEPQ